MTLSKPYGDTYFTELQETIARLPGPAIDHVASILLESARRGQRVFICGNGGSASTASHFACDLAKNTTTPGAPRLRVVPLTDNVAMMTAWANDTGYDNVFAAQLLPLVEEGDVVIGISCSGNSPNVLNAMVVARQHGAITIGFTGDQGGQLIDLVDFCVQVSSPTIEIQEDVHLALGHSITMALRAELKQEADRNSSGLAMVLPQEKILTGKSISNGDR